MTANRISGYISIRREIGIGENDGGNDNNNNNINSNIFYIIIISTRRRQRWRWRDTTNNAWADNEHYYHGGHTPRATRSRNRVRSRTSAGAKGQCRPGRDYGGQRARSAAKSSAKHWRKAPKRHAAPPPPRMGYKVPPTPSLPRKPVFCYANVYPAAQPTPCMQSPLPLLIYFWQRN